MSRIITKTGSLAYARYQLTRAILENVLESDYTTEDRKAALQLFDGCAFCGTLKAPRNDHLVPVIGRGDFIRQNVVPACQKCDDSKGQKEFRQWMRESNSPRSLMRRGFTSAQIEKRIRLIEKWQTGYKPKTVEQLFGSSLPRYNDILQKMDALCEESRQLVKDLESEKRTTADRLSRQSQLTQRNGKTADSIRQFILDTYVALARARREKTVTIRSGDVHARMRLHQQHANVCQVMGGDKLQISAGIKLLSKKGPKACGNTYFTYRL